MAGEAITGLQALGDEYRLITQNLANANTTGFKRLVGAVFQESGSRPWMLQGPTTNGLASEVTLDLTPGRMVRTGRPLDVAIQAKGFFVLETDQGETYTRNGVFRADASGRLVNSQGRPVAGEGGPITIPSSVPQNEIHITADGTIEAAGRSIGKLRVVEFEEGAKLEPIGGCAYRAPEFAEPTTSKNPSVQQGFQEGSNVNPVSELVSLIRVSRMYEANIKAIEKKGDKGDALLRVAMA